MNIKSIVSIVILLSTLTACGKKGSESSTSNPEVINPSVGVECDVEFFKGQELSEVAFKAYKAMKECGLSEEAVIDLVSKQID